MYSLAQALTPPFSKKRSYGARSRIRGVKVVVIKVVVIKVAASQVTNVSGYWPLTLPDSIETVAASYVPGANTSKVRLFNLSPDTNKASMAVGGAAAASRVAYSLGSDWSAVPAAAGTYKFTDSATKKNLVTRSEAPPAAPLAFTNVLIGLESGSGVMGSRCCLSALYIHAGD